LGEVSLFFFHIEPHAHSEILIRKGRKRSENEERGIKKRGIRVSPFAEISPRALTRGRVRVSVRIRVCVCVYNSWWFDLDGAK